jgi:hypothetical protein
MYSLLNTMWHPLVRIYRIFLPQGVDFQLLTLYFFITGRPDTEKHVKFCSTARNLLTQSTNNVTNRNHCVSQDIVSNNNAKSLFKPSSTRPSSACSNPVNDQGDFASDGTTKLPALDVCNILISVESCSLENRLSADEVDNTSVDSSGSLDSRTSLRMDSGSVSACSADVVASSDYLPIDSVQCGSSCFSLYDSSTYVS